MTENKKLKSEEKSMFIQRTQGVMMSLLIEVSNGQFLPQYNVKNEPKNGPDDDLIKDKQRLTNREKRI